MSGRTSRADRRCTAAVIAVAAVVSAVCLGRAAPAAAQASFEAAQGFPYRRPTPRERPGVRAYVLSDRSDLSAARTFDAVFGSSRMSGRGGGAEAVRIWRGLFARAAVTAVRNTGSRVGVSGNDVFSLAIPLTLELRHAELSAGWRFRDRRRSRAVGYAGGGLLRLHYVELSSFADARDNSDEMFSGYVVFGGVDVAVWRWIMAGAEAQYRGVPGALGGGGVSKAFGETDLGGTTLRVLVGIRR